MRNKDGCRHMHRIIEVCLLVLLCRPEGENAHGYALGERLTGFGFDESEISVSTLYRTLRGMEESGWVTSSWAAGGQGPQRREYAITDAGRQALDEWAAVLAHRRERISLVLDAHAQLGRTPAAEAKPEAKPESIPESIPEPIPEAKPEPIPEVIPVAERKGGITQAASQPEAALPAKKAGPAPRREDSFVDYWD